MSPKYRCCKGLRVRAAIIDLNFSVLYGHPAGAKGRVDERGTNCIFPADGFSAAAPIPPLCEALRRPSLRDSKLHLGTGCWHVESFFRWIKQHLHIKAFYGTSENVVKTQSLGRPAGLCPGGDRQKATGAGTKSLQNSANSQRDSFRKKTDIRGVFQLQRWFPNAGALYSLSLFALR
jgi:hypothetical protein